MGPLGSSCQCVMFERFREGRYGAGTAVETPIYFAASRVTSGMPHRRYIPPSPAVFAGPKDPHVSPAPRPLQRGASRRDLRLQRVLHRLPGLLRMSGYCVFPAHDGLAAQELCIERSRDLAVDPEHLRDGD